MGNTKNAISTVIKKINSAPFIFHTESDIQALLYNNLMLEYKDTFKTKLQDHKGGFFYTNLVHTEYYGVKKGRIDIVVFSRDEVDKIDRPWLCIKTSEKPNYRPVKLSDAIEIKTEGGKGKDKLEDEVEKDIEDLKELLNNNKVLNAHFILILRSLHTKKKGLGIFEEIELKAKKMCKENNISFYCNDFRKLFE